MLRLFPVALLVAAVISPGADASATDVRGSAGATVEVGDDFFSPATVRIAPGDTVSWRWSGSNPHNVRASSSEGGFRSSIMRGSGAAFDHTFSREGRFPYLCEVHPDMRGTVEVGEPPFADTVPPRLSRLRARVRGRSVTLTFRLSEAARVRVVISGRARRTLTRRFRRGPRRVVVRRLRRGRQRATLIPTDLSGNRGRSRRVRFNVR